MQQQTLKACFMCVQSMKMASEKEKHLRTIFLLHYPRDRRQLLRNLAACRSIIPSANLQNHRVYLFNIIYANFSSAPVRQLQNFIFYAKTLFDAVLHMKIMWLYDTANESVVLHFSRLFRRVAGRVQRDTAWRRNKM